MLVTYWRVALAAAVLSVVACGGDGPAKAAGYGQAGERKHEVYCDSDAFDPTLRHTYFFLDESVLAPSSNPEEFVARNAEIRDIVRSFASPLVAQESGTAAPRERVSIFLLSRQGTAPDRLFTGCIPGLTQAERSELRSGQSDLNRFFAGDSTRDLEEAQSDFEGMLIASLMGAAREISDEVAPFTGSISDAPVFQGLASAGQLIKSDGGLPRIVIVTDLSRATLPTELDDEAAQRAEARLLAASGKMDLGLSDVLVVQPKGAKAEHQAFMHAYLLSQNGNLGYWGDSRPADVSSPAVNISRYVGFAQYPSGPEGIQIRLARDADGELVQSWMVLRGEPDRGIPLTGQSVCSEVDQCVIRSDEGGFAQIWSPEPGGAPEFENTMPFAGLRDFELTIKGDKITGRVFDPSVDQIGDDPNIKHIAIEGTRQDSAVF